MMDTLFNTISLARYLMASGIIFGLLGAFYFAALLYKRKQQHGSFQPKKRRLRVVESLPLSARHKMLIIRQDDMEHTIVIGGPSDLHIATTSAPETPAVSDQLSENNLDNDTYTIGFLKKLPTKKSKSDTTKKNNNSK